MDGHFTLFENVQQQSAATASSLSGLYRPAECD